MRKRSQSPESRNTTQFYTTSRMRSLSINTVSIPTTAFSLPVRSGRLGSEIVMSIRHASPASPPPGSHPPRLCAGAPAPLAPPPPWSLGANTHLLRVGGRVDSPGSHPRFAGPLLPARAATSRDPLHPGICRIRCCRAARRPSRHGGCTRSARCRASLDRS